MTILILILVSLLCLAFQSTRLIGVAGMAFLMHQQPTLSLAILIIAGGIAFYGTAKLTVSERQ